MVVVESKPRRLTSDCSGCLLLGPRCSLVPPFRTLSSSCPSLYSQTPRSSFLLSKLSSLTYSFTHWLLPTLLLETVLSRINSNVLVTNYSGLFGSHLTWPVIISWLSTFYWHTLGFGNTSSLNFSLTSLGVSPSLFHKKFSFWLVLESWCASKFCPRFSFYSVSSFWAVSIMLMDLVAACYMLMTQISVSICDLSPELQTHVANLLFDISV